MNEVDKTRSEMAIQKLEVSNLLGWTDMQYAEFQEAMGIEYIRKELCRNGTHSLAMELVKFKEFWSWWKLQWMRRDEEFLEDITSLFPSEYEDYYRTLHRPGTLLFRPHAGIMKSTYNQMVHRLVKQLMSKEVPL